MSIIVEMEAADIDEAEKIGRQVYERCAPLVREIDSCLWMIPVGDFKEREPFRDD